MSFFIKHTNTILLLLILLVATWLRLYLLGEHSYSNDELSAIYRLRFANFSKLIQQGVLPDGHPPGVQVFLYYYTKLFGYSEYWVRLPFALMGIGSVALTYRICQQQLNASAALWVAALMAVLFYPILYSRIARMYSSGLFFGLLAFGCWQQAFLIHKQQPYYTSKWYYAFIVSGGLCLYQHYFSFLFMAVLGLGGLFMLKKKQWPGYLWAGIGMLTLFAPAAGIMYQQLQIGGVGEWLAPPNQSFLLHYLAYCLNNSYLVIGAIVCSILVGIGRVLSNNNNRRLCLQQLPFALFSLYLFISVFLVGYFYSVYKNPVLQYSTLLFVFPFLLISVSNFIPPLSNNNKALLVLIILAIGGYSSIQEKGLFKMHHFGVFKELAIDVVQQLQQYNNHHKVALATSVNSPFYIHFYLDSISNSPSFLTYKVKNIPKAVQLLDTLANSKANILHFSWSNTLTPTEIVPMLQQEFPILLQHQYYFNSETYTLARTPMALGNSHHILLDTIVYATTPLLVDTLTQQTKLYSKTITTPLHTIANNNSIVLDASVSFLHPQQTAAGTNTAHLVIELVNISTEEVMYWHGQALSNFERSGDDAWLTAYCSYRLPAHISVSSTLPNILVKSYVWLNQTDTILVKNASLQVRNGNPIIYGKH